MLYVFIFILLMFVIFFVVTMVRALKVQNQSIILFDGGLGAGKTYSAVRKAVSKYRKFYKKYKIKLKLSKIVNFFLSYFKMRKWIPVEPVFFSSIPIRIKYSKGINIMSCKLTKDLLLGYSRFPKKSIILWDEVSYSVNQFQFKDKELELLSDVLRWFRQMTKGGFFFMTDHSFKNLPLQIKRKTNIVYSLFGFDRWLKLFPMAKVSVIPYNAGAEDLQPLLPQSEFRFFFMYFPYNFQSKKFNYDTYAGSELYADRPLPNVEKWAHDSLKLNKEDLIKIGKE